MIETVINYQLAVNMFAFDSPQKGFDSVDRYFNGLQDLRNRPDIMYKMNSYTKTKKSNQLESAIASAIFENFKFQNNTEDIRLTKDNYYNYTSKKSKI